MSQSRLEIASLPASGNTENAGENKKSGSLAIAGIAGVFASACCLGPLVLASIGLGGITAGVVAMFEPLRPVFIAVALAALGFAGWNIYRRPAQTCAPGAACDVPRSVHLYKIAFWIVAIITLALLGFPYYAALFV